MIPTRDHATIAGPRVPIYRPAVFAIQHTTPAGRRAAHHAGDCFRPNVSGPRHGVGQAQKWNAPAEARAALDSAGLAEDYNAVVGLLPWALDEAEDEARREWEARDR